MYKQEVRLQDNQGLQIIDKETGEVIKDVPSPKKANPYVESFDGGKFIKHHTGAWNALALMTTTFEYGIATKMSNLIRMITNSLEPLSDDMSLRELAEEFNISHTKAKLVFDKLFKLGVFARFEVSDWENEQFRHKKYWVFNPFLSCNGKAVDSRSKGLFSGTIFAKM